MVLVREAPRSMYDVSFMVTRQCDLECPFCMYDSSPRIHDRLDEGVARAFAESLEEERINSFGFYGGEPAVAMEAFGAVAAMLPAGKPRFVISNGAWSKEEAKTEKFLAWAAGHKMAIYVSSTPYHIRFQDRGLLERLAEEGKLTLKPGERKGDFIPMGKLGHLQVNCTQLCMRHQRPTRLAVQPDGSVIFQNCDGRYPQVGWASEGFAAIRARVEELYVSGFAAVCPFYGKAGA